MIRHAITRSLERYGIRLSDGDIRLIEWQLAHDDIRIVDLYSRTENRSRIVAARINYRWVCLASSQFHFIVTVLPECKLKPYRKMLDARKVELKRLGIESDKPNRQEVSRKVNTWLQRATIKRADQ